MDSLITAAARALAAGDPLGALNRVALRDDPPALALRGIAMAQLGEFERAKALLRDAARGFGPREAMARARCVVAEAEIAFVSRDLGWKPEALAAARATLATHGDRANAAHAGLLAARRLALIGQLDAAEEMLAGIAEPLPAATRAGVALAAAGIAIRRVRAGAAREALARAGEAAAQARIPALVAEVEAAANGLDAVAAHLVRAGETEALRLDAVEAVLASGVLVVDACRHAVRRREAIVPLATRPVLFALAQALAEAWPGDVSREALVARAFRGREADESHRARLRVEIGRLRAALRPLATIAATRAGFALSPHEVKGGIAILMPAVEGPHAAVLALLADGEAWSSSALALALGVSPRTVQRALEALGAAGKVQAFGRGPARRFVAPALPGFPTALLLPGPLPAG
jgi:DNA-binding transcriptional ArsR family regulator